MLDSGAFNGAENHLRSLADQLLPRVQNDPGALLVTSSQLQCVANAYVMLGLLPEERAEAVLIDHRRAVENLGIELHGVKTGELTLVPTSAHGFADAIARTEDELRELPRAFATPHARLAVANGILVLDCLLLTRTGLRGRIWIEGNDAADLPPWPELIQDVSLADDAGRSYRVQVAASGSIVTNRAPDELPARQLLGVALRVEPTIPDGVQWLDVASSISPAVRINFDPPSSPPSGTIDPPWSSPAERYLAWLAKGLPDPKSDAVVGVGLAATEAREVVVAVRDALLAVGALAPECTILQQLSAPRHPDTRARLTRQFVSQVRDGFIKPSTEQNLIALGSPLPLRQTTMMISWMIVREGVVHFELYVSPDTRGEYWPVATRPYEIRVTDNLCGEYEATAATYWRGQGGEAWGDQVLRPRLNPRARRLRFQVNTLWEGAWVAIALTT